ncbi:MAG: hypothetical protein QM729_14815 [Solirubrobacterales bacterium]
MFPAPLRAFVLGLGVCLVVVGCGGGGSSTEATAAGGGREAIHEPVQSRGIKGEDPNAEAATRAHISAADCAALGRLAEERLGTELARRSDPSPPLSHCRLTGHGASITVYLDSGFAAHQRYSNRIEETVQFNEQHPAGLPHPVPHVGEKAAYDADANWIPALRSLLALRGNRWLTVTISAAGRSNAELRDEAAVLARAGFKLSADG